MPRPAGRIQTMNTARGQCPCTKRPLHSGALSAVQRGSEDETTGPHGPVAAMRRAPGGAGISAGLHRPHRRHRQGQHRLAAPWRHRRSGRNAERIHRHGRPGRSAFRQPRPGPLYRDRETLGFRRLHQRERAGERRFDRAARRHARRGRHRRKRRGHAGDAGHRDQAPDRLDQRQPRRAPEHSQRRAIPGSCSRPFRASSSIA